MGLYVHPQPRLSPRPQLPVLPTTSPSRHPPEPHGSLHQKLSSGSRCPAYDKELHVTCILPVLSNPGERYCLKHKEQCRESVQKYKEAFYRSHSLREASLLKADWESYKSIEDLEAAIRVTKEFRRWVRREKRERRRHMRQFYPAGACFSPRTLRTSTHTDWVLQGHQISTKSAYAR